MVYKNHELVLFNNNSYIDKETTVIGNVTFTVNSSNPSNRNGISHNVTSHHSGGINGFDILGIL